MDKHFLARGLGTLLLAGMGTIATAQNEEDPTEEGERRVRIEITKNENGKTSHVTREFDLNNDQELHDALRELGVIDELSTIGNGEKVVLDLRRTTEGGTLNNMCMALSMPEDVPAMGTVRRPYLGVTYEDWNGGAKKKDRAPVKSGAYLSSVIDGSSAEKGGLQEGDVVVDIGGARITSGEDLANAVDASAPGEKLKIIYYRGSQKRTAQVELGWREGTPELSRWNWSGGESPDWEAYFGDAWPAQEEKNEAFLGVVGGSTEDGSAGVRIGEVVAGSAAEKMGLKEGDVLRSINGKQLADFGDLADEVSGLEPEEEVKLGVLRDGKKMDLEGVLGKRTVQRRGFRAYTIAPPEPAEMPDPYTAPMPSLPPAPPVPQRGNGRIDPEDQAAYEERMRTYEQDMAEYHQDIAEHARDMSEYARDMNEYARDRAEHQRELAEIRAEMDRLRQELRTDITREMRVTINSIELSPEEKMMLKGKGVDNLDQPLELNGLQCFPDPSEGSFHLLFQVPERGDLSVDLHDATGERVYHEVISGFKGNYDRTLDLSDKATGTYFAVITQGGKARTLKLVRK